MVFEGSNEFLTDYKFITMILTSYAINSHHYGITQTEYQFFLK